MKYKLIFLAVFLAVVPVCAQTDCPKAIESENLERLINTLVEIQGVLQAIAFVIAAIGYIYVGYLFITATDDPEKINQAKTGFKNVTIGVVIIYAASFIAGLLRDIVCF
jgi:hypothetical protein